MNRFAILKMSRWIPYLKMTKPGIVLGNLLTASGGFALLAKGHVDYGLLLATLVGLGAIIASGCVLNNYLDRHFDGKMRRTMNRELVLGTIPLHHAVRFAIALGLLGLVILLTLTNLLTTLIALSGFLLYVFLYSPAKYRSVYSTHLGSLAGAVPPVVGYCAVGNRLDSGALLVFVTVALWQMPHFFSIAIYRYDDYKAASIPVFSVGRGISATKRQMVGYILIFIGAAAMLPLFGYVGTICLIGSTLLGVIWLYLAIRGFARPDHANWARGMFRYSLLVITALSIAMWLD